ncbi:hypothetical protein ACVIM8_006731 [Bradyrhizobium sp. USDA 4529]
MWDWLRRLYWRLYNKLVPLPSDEVLSERLRSILESRNIEAAPPEEMPAAASCCIVTFDEGGTVCSPDIHDQPTCTVWAHSFGRPASGLIFPGRCPAGSGKIVRR